MIIRFLGILGILLQKFIFFNEALENKYLGVQSSEKYS